MRRQASDAYEQASTNVNDMMNRGRAAVARGREAFVSARDRAVDEVPRRVESAVSEIRSGLLVSVARAGRGQRPAALGDEFRRPPGRVRASPRERRALAGWVRQVSWLQTPAT